MKKAILIYSKRERWGILSLAFLNLVLLLISFSHTAPKYHFSEANILAFQGNIEKPKTKTIIAVTDSLFQFNPNEASKEELILLGFSERVSNNIINYRNKGGQFYNTNSLKKIYGMDSLFFDKIKDYCIIPSDKSDSKPTFTKRFAQAKKAAKRFIFNPNTATKQQLLDLGFPLKSTNALVNYRNKGGHFYKPESLKKIFGITEHFFQSIQPLIQIEKPQYAYNQQLAPNTESSNNSSSFKKFTKKTSSIRPEDKKLEINSATIEEWESLPGIGPFYAKNIVKLKEKLGGFHDITQIKETYRFSDSTFQVVKKYLIINKRLIQKLDLQRASFKEINRHPYITYETTKLLMNAQRDGKLYSIDDLKSTQIFSESELAKLVPYLIFPEADYEE